jgi:hypothetical protein
LDQVGACEEGDLDWDSGTIRALSAPEHFVYLVIEMVQHERCGHVFGLYGLPSINHEPTAVLNREFAHTKPAERQLRHSEK